MARSGRNIFQIDDPNMREVLKVIWDQLDLIQGDTNAPAWRGSVNAGKNPLTNLADGMQPTDAVTLAQLKAATDHKSIARALSASGAAPLNVTNLIGAGGGLVLSGAHTDRLATPAVAGSWFYETDRTALYGCLSIGNWTLMAGVMGSSVADMPADLGLSDINFIYLQQDLNYGNAVWYWSGNTWHLSTAWFHGALADINNINGAGLGATPALKGSFYEATNYDRVYFNTGAAWQDAVGQTPRNQISLFTVAPGAGWALCDGSTVTGSTSSGGTTSVTTPNLTAGSLLGTGAAVSAATIAAVGTFYTESIFLPYIRL